MADQKISALTAASTPLAGTEVLPIVQGGSTVKVSVANLTAGRPVAMAGGSFTDNITQGVAAKGFNFTANTPAAGMTSQLLNWYEEGTFTPTITVLGSGTITLNTASGRYTRIGRQVTVIGSIAVLSVSSPTGDAQIGGFPLATAINSTVSLNGTGFQATAATQLMGRLDSGQSGFYLFHFAAGTASGAAADFKAGTSLQFSCTYFV